MEQSVLPFNFSRINYTIPTLEKRNFIILFVCYSRLRVLLSFASPTKKPKAQSYLLLGLYLVDGCISALGFIGAIATNTLGVAGGKGLGVGFAGVDLP